ncbi:MAG: hypothetical protein WBF84_06990 [Castellaniella sp.]|uniref:hypothetical protein n=1 Tax=Castellaniella sp. TaxID=1955812 RepID=UPI003C77CA5C
MFDFKETAENFGLELKKAGNGILEQNLPKVQDVLDASIKQAATQFDEAAGHNIQALSSELNEQIQFAKREFDDTIRVAKVEIVDAVETSLRGFRKHVIAPFWMLMFAFGVVMAGLAGFVIGHGW